MEDKMKKLRFDFWNLWDLSMDDWVITLFSCGYTSYGSNTNFHIVVLNFVFDWDWTDEKYLIEVK
jgi:hypothetical protein